MTHHATTRNRLTENDVRDLVNQLAAMAGIARPAVAFLPWLDDRTALVHLAFRPGNPHEPARVDIDRSALEDLSPAAWRHVLAHEIGHLNLHNTHATVVVPDPLEVIGGAFGLAAIAWYILRDQSLGILATGISVLLLATAAKYAWYLKYELQADRYAVRIAGLDAVTIDEIWTNLDQITSMTFGERYRRNRLRRLAESTPPKPTRGAATSPNTEPWRGMDDGGAS